MKKIACVFKVITMLFMMIIIVPELYVEADEQELITVHKVNSYDEMMEYFDNEIFIAFDKNEETFKYDKVWKIEIDEWILLAFYKSLIMISMRKLHGKPVH